MEAKRVRVHLPDNIQLTLSLNEAKQLKELVSLNVTISERVHSLGNFGPFMGDLHCALRNVEGV